MAANSNERTFIPAIIPPGASHINGVFSVGSPRAELTQLVNLAGAAGSLLNDFLVRSAPKNGIFQATFDRLALPAHRPEIVLRALRLNCVTDAYADLWAACWDPTFAEDTWTGGLDHERRHRLGDVEPNWTADTPFRIAADRRQALVEIDALVGLSLGITADELCTIYRTQFAVLYGYDRNRDHYDANGRLVPNPVLTVWRKKGNRLTVEERTATNQAGNTYVYELPFVTLDREKDMRVAYEHFERRLAERS